MKNLADENADIVRRGYEAFNKADMKTLNELFDDNAIWHSPGRNPISGHHKGREAVFTQFGRYGGDTGGTFKADLKHVLASDDGTVVGVHHNTGERNGKKLDVWCCLFFRIKEGKVIDGREHFYDLYAWDDFWS